MIKKIIWIFILAGLLLYAVPKILEQFSLVVDKLNSDTSIEEEANALLFPPILDTLPDATNSSTVTIKGFAQNADRVEIYDNDIKKETVTIGTKDGSFTAIDIKLYEGSNVITGIAFGPKGEKSNPSEPLQINFKKAAPKLVIESPEDGSTVNGNNKIELRGITDAENTLTINGRWTRVLTDGTFKSVVNLNEGENKIEVLTRDRAGNEMRIERTVTYSK
jgi:hypothetical protein